MIKWRLLSPLTWGGEGGARLPRQLLGSSAPYQVVVVGILTT
jgi:hypothetical protein